MADSRPFVFDGSNARFGSKPALLEDTMMLPLSRVDQTFQMDLSGAHPIADAAIRYSDSLIRANSWHFALKLIR